MEPLRQAIAKLENMLYELSLLSKNIAVTLDSVAVALEDERGGGGGADDDMA